ncbi:MAG: aldo/keto reductase [Propionibacteriaceae bacterium]|jgi:aryl-alcohol dehydrogenase-like predicted oxidoreductase|nr:aldo/keto reductase [Propionibacteriaceae bacterium]
MRHRQVGKSGLSVSRTGLGTLTWGRDTSYEDARRMALAFVEAGGDLIDTAAAYGGGDAERIIGKLIRTELNRESLVIATKAGFVSRDGKQAIDTSRQTLLADLRESLRRLHTDHIDLWQLHAWGDAPLEESLAAIDTAVAAGSVRYAGVSNFVGWQTAQAATWQRAFPGRAKLASAQVEYSLLARRAEFEIIPALRAFGMGLFPWSPLGRGVLTGKYSAGSVPRGSRADAEHFSWFIEPYLGQPSSAIVYAVQVAARGMEMTPAQVALLWVRDAPGVTAPLLGSRNLAQLRPLLEAEQFELPPEITQALDDVSGGPNELRLA